MRLLDLEPEWVHDYDAADRSHHRSADLSIENAQGILFECPLCRGHSVLAWFRGRGVPDDATPGPGRWTPAGTGFADLSLTPSIALQGGCGWHGFVTNGDAT